MFANLCNNSPASILSVSQDESTGGGMSFKEHSINPKDYTPETPVRSIAKIRQGGWDYVTLQEQSGSSLVVDLPHESYA